MIRLCLVAGLILLVGAACSIRTAAPAPDLPGVAVPSLPSGASPSEREDYYRAKVALLTEQLDGARGALVQAQRDADDARLRAWRDWTRWIGVAGIALAVLVGGVLCWLVSPRFGIPAGVIVASTALAVVLYGATLRWLPLVLGGTVLLAVVVWALYHWRLLRVGAALSRTVDTVEGNAKDTTIHAKQVLRDELIRSGLAKRFDRLRETWQRSRHVSRDPT